MFCEKEHSVLRDPLSDTCLERFTFGLQFGSGSGNGFPENSVRLSS